MAAPDATWVKRVDGGPVGYADWEAAGLRWLGEATTGGGADVVGVREVRSDGLVLDRLVAAAPTAKAAEDFGAALASTHRAGAAAWGAPPPGWDREGWFGPAASPLPLEVGSWPSWGEMYAVRLAALTRLARDARELDAEDASAVDRLGGRCAAGDFDTGDTPSRVHGDLWSGNLMWTAHGVVLIDPAAHGGHRESDLAMLALFGAPHLDRIVAAYEEVSPLDDGWRARIPLHQLHPLLVHAVLFGGGYAGQVMAAVRAC
ncbi:fructosamine kinase family protein [Knoellia locipacati]|uniref:fructosamine kinase family protein n=1 Tax=Knoellia locipacati TaxID=882824 RepID=UPI00384FF222